MNYEIEFLPDIIVVGKEIRTTNKNMQCMKDINELWGHIKKNNAIAQIPHKVEPVTIISLYTNYAADFTIERGMYSVIIGALVTQKGKLPKDMVMHELSAAQYAVFTAHGPFDTAIAAAWQTIWKCTELQRTFEGDFELYDEKSTNDANSIVKIYIAVN